MKRYADFFKNIAALILLIALVALLLPLCKITTFTESATVTGFGVLRAGINASYEYYSKGKIESDYALGEHLTWGDIENATMYAAEQVGLRNVVTVGVILSLPIVFSLFAIILTLIARGKKMMLVSTLLVTLTFLENIALIVIFFRIQKRLFPFIDLTLLAGHYVFTALSGIVLIILGLLWMTGGFNKPEEQDRGQDKKSKEKTQSKVRGKRRDKRKKKKQNKKKGKKENRREDTREQGSQGDESINKASIGVAGQLVEASGIYEGLTVELSKLDNGIYTIGTTKEAVEAIQKGITRHMDKIDNHSCIIEYSSKDNRYKVTSYSEEEIVLESSDSSKPPIKLQKGESQIIEDQTTLLVGNSGSSIKLV